VEALRERSAAVDDIAPKLIRLGEIADGAAEELFQAALRQVLESMDDLNTDWRSKREITLRFTFKTTEERKAAAVAIACTTKLPSVKPVGLFVHLGRHKGHLAAVEAMKQEEMFKSPTGRPVAISGPEIK
jgi:hypothetical protein